MKLLVIQFTLFIAITVTILTGHIQYAWIMVVLMTIPAILLSGLACNWPMLGLLAARFEWGNDVKCFLHSEKLHIDNNYIAWGDQTIRVIHARKYGNYYKIWFLYVGPASIQPITLVS